MDELINIKKKEKQEWQEETAINVAYPGLALYWQWPWGH